jgi:hypothetical protein
MAQPLARSGDESSKVGRSIGRRVFDGTTPHEQHVIGPAKSQRDMVQASLNGEEGRARHDVYRARLGERRQGWRGRLAHTEFMLTTAQGWLAKGTEHGEAQGRACLEDAIASVRAMIDAE